MLKSEIVARLTLEVFLRIDGKRLDVGGIRHDYGTSIVNLHLTVGTVLCWLAIDVDIAELLKCQRGIKPIEHHCGMLSIGDVYRTCSRERRS